MEITTKGKIAFAVLILVVTSTVIALLKIFAPVAEEEKREKALPLVEAISIESGSALIEIPSQGLVEAPTETSLAAEVGGKVISVSEKFEVGQDFEEDEVLFEIDQADYLSALAQMEANVADAELNLALEEGRSRAALRDWESSGIKDPPGDLALRKPQLKSAEAKLASAKAAAEKAKRDLERTKIRAPYDCRIRATYTEIGSFIAPGSRVADVYELGRFEIRLPVALDDYAFINDSGTGGAVEFTANIGGTEKNWKGSVVRNEGVIDRTSRSVYLVASIDAEDGGKFLSPGLFVKATIAGRRLDNVISLPRKALYGKDRIYVIDAEDKLHFRDVEVARTERDRVLISGGLEAGERVCITNLAAAIDKMEVKILGGEDGEDAGAEEEGETRSAKTDV